MVCKLIIRLFEDKEDECPFDFGDSEADVSPQNFANLTFADETKIQKKMSLPIEIKVPKKMSLISLPPKYEEFDTKENSNPSG